MANLPKIVKKSLIDVLKEEGLVKEDILPDLLAQQKASGKPFHQVLHDLGLLNEMDLVRVISKQLALPYLNAAKYHVSKDVVGIFEVLYMMKNQFVPLDKIGRAFVVALAGPPAPELVEHIEKTTGSPAFFYLSTLQQIEAAIAKHHGAAPAEAAAGGG